MGDIQNSIIAVALASADFRNHEWATYIDDTWKVRPHLTITLGLRWEVAQPMLDASGHEVGVQLNAPLANIANVPDMSQHPVYVHAVGGACSVRGEVGLGEPSSGVPRACCGAY